MTCLSLYDSTIQRNGATLRQDLIVQYVAGL